MQIFYVTGEVNFYFEIKESGSPSEVIKGKN